MNLSSRRAIDLVLDCGAIGDGAHDCTAALNKAGVILAELAAGNSATFPEVAQTLKLWVPPGVYRIDGVPNDWNFTNTHGTSVEVVGAGDSSMFAFNGGGGISIDCDQIWCHDFACYGLPVNPNCGTCLNLNAVVSGRLDRVHVFNVNAVIACIFLSGTSWHATDDTIVQCCVLAGGPFPGGACLYSSGVSGLILDNVVCQDIGHLNGQVGNSRTSLGNLCWIRHDDSSPISGDRNRGILLRNTRVSAGAISPLIIKGGATLDRSLHYVNLKGFSSEPSALANTGAIAVIDNVDLLDVDGFIDAGATTGETGQVTPALKLTRVKHAKIRRLAVAEGSPSNFITADNTCGIVELEDQSGNPVVTSSAARTSLRVGAGQDTSQDGTGLPPVGQAQFTVGLAAVVSAFPMNEGSFAGRVSVLARLVTPGAGGGAMGDFYAADFFLKAKTVGGVTTLMSAAADGATINDASLAGIVIQFSVATNNVKVSFDATLATSGAGCLIDVQVSVLPEANVFHTVTPSQIPGLELWLDASQGVTVVAGHVSEWDDQSGTGDANKNCLQATAGNRPVFNSTNPLFNGQPTIDFNGTTDYLQSGAWAAAQAQPFTAFFVGSNPSLAGTKIGLDNLAAHQTSIASAATIPQAYAGAGLDDVSGASFVNPLIVGAVFNGNNSQLYINQLTGQAVGAAGANNLQGTTIGGFGAAPGNTTNSWAGSIAMVIVYNGVLSAAQIKAVMGYLAGRFNIPLAA